MQRVYGYLPRSILALLSEIDNGLKKEACELRLRAKGALSVTTYSKNLFITPRGKPTSVLSEGYVCTADDLMYTVSRLSEDSVYRYMPTISMGYMVTRDGIRVGIVGEAVYSKGSISSVSDFTSLNIRLPRDVDGAGDGILKHLTSFPRSSMLIYSPPGVGKTTVIRAVAKGLGTGRASKAVRVAVVDERGEILPHGSVGLVDRLCGYSKPDGIEIAVRLMSPEYIVCDEIGLSDDTRAILSVENSGVPFIATTHGSSISEVLKRPNIRELIDHGIFDSFVRLERGINGANAVFEELDA